MNFIKRFKFLIIIGLIIIAGVAYFSLKPKPQPRIDTVVAERGDLKQFVSVVGKVKPSEDVDLAFETGGKVSKVYVQVGDKVEVGDKLVELNMADLYAELQQASAQVVSAQATLGQYQAALTAEQAKLEEMQSGTRPEEIVIAQTKVANAQSDLDNEKIDLETAVEKAQTDLDNLYDDVLNTLNDAYIKSDNAINTQLDDLFTNAANVEFTFEPNNSQLEVNTLEARRDAINGLADLRDEISKTHTTNAEFDNALSTGKTVLVSVRYFLNLVGDILDGDTDLSSTNLSTYKSNLNTARGNVNTALTSISNLQQSISAQKNTNTTAVNSAQALVDGAEYDLQSAQDELKLKLAGYTKEQIDAQVAKVQQAEANINSQKAIINQRVASVSSAQARIEKNIIYSPIKGIVTKQEAKEAEIMAPNTTVVSVISEVQFEIEANVTEIDISKVKIGDNAQVTLDAYGDDKYFDASVVSVDPAEKIIEGVATYKTTLQFASTTEEIKSGMSADLEIMTDSRQNVIAIPQRAVIYKDNKKIVRVMENGQVVEREVETGIKGSDGRIEITSGLKEGDTVVTFME